ncbi:hypothetical protein SFRURICE_015737 [Spodoptera frugiperda]|nr:hypothetical protein SFRURICE_015737 [Spodoptera frugiperda]
MENATGEEVALRIEPDDNFQMALLGFDVDLNSITRNQPVSLSENVYQFLINAEQNLQTDDLTQNFDPMLDPNDGANDLVYILDDGTQIRASQIHFDNDDPLIDLTAEKIPFVKYADDVNDDIDLENVHIQETKKINIVESPVSRWSSKNSSPKCSFINSLPFKLVCNNTSGFEAQFTKYLEANSSKTYATLNPVTIRNKSPKSLIKDNFKNYDESYQRNDNLSYTREEILNMFKDSPMTSLPYDQGYSERKHKKMSTQLKIICECCLNENFKPCRMKSANQFLNPDEFLVIRNNQQYIFQKVKNFSFTHLSKPKEVINKVETKIDKEEFVKVEIGSDGEIITKPIDNDPRSDDVIIVKDEKKEGSSSDVEIIEPEPEIDNIIDNLEEADEDVKEFLGKYQCDNSEITELKCRFCEQIFPELSGVTEHCETHKHDLEDGEVFPCPLCNYELTVTEPETGTPSSPIATRTRSSNKKDGDKKEPPIIKTEVKQECLDSSEDEIWIVQTADADAQELQKLLCAAKVKEDGQEGNSEKMHKCYNCSQVFASADGLSSHRCRRRGRKRKSKDLVNLICIPTEEDFLKRAQGRPRQNDSGVDNDLIVMRPRKRRSRELTSNPQVVTCHNCNESFTSKVRLKFHMQFHDTARPVRSDGRYLCAECEGASFATETELFDHVHFQHDKQKRWQCPVEGCGKTFFLRATLTKHSRTHTDTRRYVCVTCDKRFLDKQTLDEHGVTHLQIKPFQCHICLKQLTRRSRLRMHVRAHEEELAPRLVRVCAEHASKSTECIEAFANELKEEAEEVTVQLSPTSGLVRHTVQIVESPKLSKPIKREVSLEVGAPLLAQLADEARALIRVVEIEKAFRCEYCEDSNTHVTNRCTTHKTTHGFYKRSLADAKKTDGLSATDGANRSATGILGYGDFPVVKHFLCEDCGRSYLHWTYLQVHRRMKHANENFLYKCNQCELTFPNRIPCRDCSEVLPNKTALYKHRKKEHSDGATRPNTKTGPYTNEESNSGGGACTRCHATFTHAADLHKHVNEQHLRVHTGERPFPCDVCGVAFRRSTAMRNHRLIHTGVRAWACGRCPKRFRIRSDLRTHLRLKHPATIVVVEMEGLNPTSEEIMKTLALQNVPHDKLIEITKMSFSKFQPARRGRGIAKNPRRPKILQRGEAAGHDNTAYPIVSGEELSDLNVQLLLRDGVLVNGNQMVQLQLDDPMLME